MTTITAADLSPWGAPDDLLEFLYRLGEQSRETPADEEVAAAVAELLNHEDEDIREEALRLVLVQWKDRQMRARGLELLQFDPSVAVRGTAAFGLAAISTAETRLEDLRALLELLVDETQGLHVRGAAYEALLIIERRAEFPPVTRDLDPVVDVDWDWVKRLQRQV